MNNGSDEERLLHLADSVAEGEEVDWASEEELSVGADEKGIVEELGVISRIGKANQTLQSADSGEFPEQEAFSEFPASEPKLGTWGPLILLEKVGEGASAEVYRAKEPSLDRVVALKLLHRNHSDDPRRSRAVMKEAKLLAQLKHRNVATIYGTAEYDGRVGFWMEFVQGNTLSKLVRSQGPLGPKVASLIGIDLCRALAAVHQKGVVHRDIKAQNVIREEGGRIVLVDFGIGQELDASRESEVGLSGTPLYLAPEVFEGKNASFPSDIYSLGVLLFFLVTSNFPVAGKTLGQIRRAHEAGERRRLRGLRPDLRADFVRTVEKALGREAGDRFQTAGDLELALGQTLEVDTTTIHLVPLKRKTPVGRLRPWLLAITFFFFVFVWFSQNPFPRPKTPEDGSTSVIVTLDRATKHATMVEETTYFAMLSHLGRSNRIRLLEPTSSEFASLDESLIPGEPIKAELMPELLSLVPKASIVKLKVVEAAEGNELSLTVLRAGSDPYLGRVGPIEADGTGLRKAIGELSLEARRYLGEKDLHREESDLARTDFHPVGLQALNLFFRALNEYSEGKTEGAADLLDLAVIKDPKFALAHRWLGLMQMSQGSYDLAFEAAEKAYLFRDSATDRERLLIEGTYFFRSFQFEKAAKAYRLLHTQFGVDGDSLRQLAHIEGKRFHYASAIRSAREAVEEAPEDVLSQGLVVILLAENNQPEKAIERYEEAVRALGEQPYLFWGKGLALLQSGRLAEAERAFAKMAEGDETYASYAARYQAQILIMRGSFREAIRFLEKNVGAHLKDQFQSNEATRQLWLAKLHLLLDEPDSALMRLRYFENLKDLPIHLVHFWDAASVLVQLGEISRARSLLRRMERLSKAYPGSLARGAVAQIRGEIALFQGNLDKARDELVVARDEYPEVGTLRALASYWELAGEPGQAAELYREVVKLKGRVLRSGFAESWQDVTSKLRKTS